jgi:hypothetical protein
MSNPHQISSNVLYDPNSEPHLDEGSEEYTSRKLIVGYLDKDPPSGPRLLLSIAEREESPREASPAY